MEPGDKFTAPTKLKVGTVHSKHSKPQIMHLVKWAVLILLLPK
jgi:hypothetical protein